jgi:hypothetical protein
MFPVNTFKQYLKKRSDPFCGKTQDLLMLQAVNLKKRSEALTKNSNLPRAQPKGPYRAIHECILVTGNSRDVSTYGTTSGSIGPSWYLLSVHGSEMFRVPGLFFNERNLYIRHM